MIPVDDHTTVWFDRFMSPGKVGLRIRVATTGSLVASILTWAWWFLDPTAPESIFIPIAITAILVVNIVLTFRKPAYKRAVVVRFQRWILNPVVRFFFLIGFVPFGYVLLETEGRRSGLPRATPVGNGTRGDTLWIVAEHGLQANYVRNIRANPEVRVKLRRGLRFKYVNGVATVLPDDDVLKRQKMVCGLRPLRLLNAVMVRTLGTDLVTVKVDLLDRPADRTAARQVGRATRVIDSIP